STRERPAFSRAITSARCEPWRMRSLRSSGLLAWNDAVGWPSAKSNARLTTLQTDGRLRQAHAAAAQVHLFGTAKPAPALLAEERRGGSRGGPAGGRSVRGRRRSAG